MHIDFDLIIYAAVALIVIGRLWSVLGTRNEDEPQRPNPFVPPTPQPDPKDEPFNAAASPLLQPPPPPASLAGGLAQIQAIDAAFDERQFMQQARESFKTIVESYARADMTAIADLVAPALLAHFQKAADARAAQGQTAQTRILTIKDAEPVAARAEGTQAFVTVKFVSDQENILRDARGNVIGGVEGKSEEITDIWVFARDLQAPDAKWLLVETRG